MTFYRTRHQRKIGRVGASFAFLIAALGAADCVVAQVQPSKYNLHVLRLFSEGQTTAGFFPVEDISPDCLWGLMYIDLSNAAGRGQLALLVQAKALGLKLQRIDFTKNANGTCLTTGIHVE